MSDPSVAFPANPREQYFNQLLCHLGVTGRPSETGLMGCDDTVVDWIRLKHSDLLRRHDGGGHE